MKKIFFINFLVLNLSIQVFSQIRESFYLVGGVLDTSMNSWVEGTYLLKGNSIYPCTNLSDLAGNYEIFYYDSKAPLIAVDYRIAYDALYDSIAAAPIQKIVCQNRKSYFFKILKLALTVENFPYEREKVIQSRRRTLEFVNEFKNFKDVYMIIKSVDKMIPKVNLKQVKDCLCKE